MLLDGRVDLPLPLPRLPPLPLPTIGTSIVCGTTLVPVDVTSVAWFNHSASSRCN